MADQVYPVNHNGDHPAGDASWDDGQAPASRLMSQEGVFQLTQDLRKFSETLTSLKSVFCEPRDSQEQSLRVVAHECLGELLKVLKNIVNKYTELNSTGILNAAENLINHIKNFNYESDEEAVSPEIFSAINNLALAFSSSVSECLIGDINISPRQSMAASQSYENLPIQNPPGHQRQHSMLSESGPDSINTNITTVDYPLAAHESVADVLAQVTENLDICFERAKAWSKYANDLIVYVKKKAHIEMEYAKQLTKLSQTTRAILSEQSFLPFQSLYCTALDNDKEYASNLVSTHQTLILAHKFIEPLQARRLDHDRQHKGLRDAWRKDKRRLEEAEVNLKKAKQQYQTRNQEYQKAKEAAIKADQQQLVESHHVRQSSNPGSANLAVGTGQNFVLPSSKMEKRKKQEDDSYLKATQAELYYRACINEANSRRKELERKEEQHLKTLRELMTQSDQTTKAVTLSFFQLHCDLTSPLRVQYQALLDESKNYEPGFQYAEYLKHVTPHQTVGKVDYQFEPYAFEGSAYMDHNSAPMRAEMAPPDDSSPLSARSSQVGRFSAARRASHRGFSDTESSSSRSLDDISPSASPGDPPNRKDLYKRRPSTEGSLSSEELLEDSKETTEVLRLVPPLSTEQGVSSWSPESSPAPVRSQFPKVMKVVANALKGIKRNTKPTVFGVDFSVAAQESPDGVPLLVKKCIAEIDNRALSAKGIYRVNGVKNRVEKLCSLLDTPNCLKVDLSEQLPHDVSGVLKYFLRQLPEPLLLYRFYNDFLDVAKIYHEAVKELKALDPPPPTDGEDLENDRVPSLPEITQEERNAILSPALERMRGVIEKLPECNRNTLQYITAHLSRIAEHHTMNKMNASNLAIIFGPTLLRPVQEVGNELQTLIELPSQSHAIEMLITHRNKIFDTYSKQANAEEVKDQNKNRNSTEVESTNHEPAANAQSSQKVSGLSTTISSGSSGDVPATTEQVHLIIDDTSQSTTATSSSGEFFTGTDDSTAQRNSFSGDSSQTSQSNGGMIDDGRTVISHSVGLRKSSSSRDVPQAVFSSTHQDNISHDDLSLQTTSNTRSYLRPTSLQPHGRADKAVTAPSLSPVQMQPRLSPIAKDPADFHEIGNKIEVPVAPARLKTKQKRGDKKKTIIDFPLYPDEVEEPLSPTKRPISPHRPRSRHVSDPKSDIGRDKEERSRRISMPVSPRTEQIQGTKTKRHSTLATMIHPTAYRSPDVKPNPTSGARRLPQVPSPKGKATSPIRAHPGRTPPFKSQSWSFAKFEAAGGDRALKEERGVSINNDPVQKRILMEEDIDEEVSFC